MSKIVGFGPSYCDFIPLDHFWRDLAESVVYGYDLLLTNWKPVFGVAGPTRWSSQNAVGVTIRTNFYSKMKCQKICELM